ATELAVFMAGWASNNKFSMLGAMRAIAQMFSYELPLIIAVLPVVMAVGSLVPDTIVAAQGEYTFGIVPRWFVFTPWGAAAFLLHLASGAARAHASGSNGECRLEVYVTGGVHLCHRRGCVALCGARLPGLAVVSLRDRRCLQRAVDFAGHAKEIRAARLSFR